MTDKPTRGTVIVSRELLEKALKADASQGATAWELHEGWLAMKVLRAALAAPVQGGQEPVAWQNPEHDSSMCTAEHKAYALSKGGAPASAFAKFTRPLYAAPVRAVKLPERLPDHEWSGDYPSGDSYNEGYAEGFNEALDAVAHLNNPPTEGTSHDS